MRIAIGATLFLVACSSSTVATGGSSRSADATSSTSSETSSAAVTSSDTTSSGATCLGIGADCTSAPNACCSGICSEPLMAGETAACAQLCTTGADCNSGCCAPLTNTGMLVCEPRGFCSATCVQPGGACATGLDCCASETCVTTNGGTCAAICTSNAQCSSGCCAPLNNASVSVCSAPQFCP